LSINNNSTEDNNCFPPWFEIKTETRRWLVREPDILADGSIPKAEPLERLKGKASRIRRLRKEEATT
jgi:hypothetical protein